MTGLSRLLTKALGPRMAIVIYDGGVLKSVDDLEAGDVFLTSRGTKVVRSVSVEVSGDTQRLVNTCRLAWNLETGGATCQLAREHRAATSQIMIVGQVFLAIQEQP